MPGNERRGCGELSGERPIRGNGKLGAPDGTWLYPALVVACLFVLAGCGDGGGDATPTPTPSPVPEATAPASGPAFDAGLGEGQAESTKDVPFTLNTDQPVPPDFEEAYGRGARIVVQFYKLDEDTLSYPQGLEVDRQVNRSMERLSRLYPTIEFFSYEITDPGPIGGDKGLQDDQYGTLAAQLAVGITPFVAMLAPSGDGYAITNLFQGYVPEPVLSQALFDLAAVQVEDNTSDVNVRLDQVQTSDGGIEYFSVNNGGEDNVNLNGFELRVLDPENAEVDPDLPGVTVNSDVRVEPGESVSIGRDADVKDEEGERVAGTFEGGTDLNLAPGDQVALLDTGGAVASTITI